MNKQEWKKSGGSNLIGILSSDTKGFLVGHLIYGRVEPRTTTLNSEGMVSGIALFGVLERHFCHEKRPFKKKVTCRLRESSCSCTVILDHENGSLRLQKEDFGDDIP